jgi:adenylate cyclase
LGTGNPSGEAARIVLAREPDFALGRFQLSPSTCEARTPDGVKRVEPRVMEVLVALARAGGRTVTRDQLVEVCWEGRIVSDDAINRVIGRIRRLVDMPNPPFSLQTIPRVGFRLAVNVGSGRSSVEAEPQQGSTGRPSIAVLPFACLGEGAEQESFARGLTEDILTTLSKLSGLSVIAHHTSFALGRGADLDAHQLGVRFVLGGSIRRDGTRVRVAARLVDPETGEQVWAERYDRDVKDIFAIQDELALILVREMQVRLLEGEQARLRCANTTNIAAWSLWAEGLSHFRSGVVSREVMGRAEACWERALEIDPQSATLNALLGLLQQVAARLGWTNEPAAHLARASAYIERALSLDAANADAYTTLGLVMLQKGQFDDAVDAARRGVSLAPGAADVSAYAAATLAFAELGEEAVPHIENAVRLSPVCPVNYLGIQGQVYRSAGHLQAAIRAFEHYRDRSPGFGHADLAILYYLTGQADLARAEVSRLRAVRPNSTASAWAATQRIRKDRRQVEEDIEALRAAGLPEA